MVKQSNRLTKFEYLIKNCVLNYYVKNLYNFPRIKNNQTKSMDLRRCPDNSKFKQNQKNNNENAKVGVSILIL